MTLTNICLYTLLATALVLAGSFMMFVLICFGINKNFKEMEA